MLRYHAGDTAVWREELRSRLRLLLGVPWGEPPKIRSVCLWSRDHEWGRIDKLVLSSEGDVGMPVYMCIPRYASAPYRTYICLQGHSSGMHLSIAADTMDECRRIEVEGDRDFAVGCMKRGMAALCIEQRGFGQRIEQKLPGTPRGLDRSCHEPAMHALMLGRTLNGERVYDVDRGIDYLETRDDIDMNHLGCMGNSTGGTVTMYAMALLDRIKQGICSSSFSSWSGSIFSVHHCVCNYIPGLALWMDMGDILAAAAPKPLVVVNGVLDPLFDITQSRREFFVVKDAYRDMGSEDQCAWVDAPEGHRFYGELAWEAMLKISPLIRSEAGSVGDSRQNILEGQCPGKM